MLCLPQVSVIRTFNQYKYSLRKKDLHGLTHQQLSVQPCLPHSLRPYSCWGAPWLCQCLLSIKIPAWNPTRTTCMSWRAWLWLSCCCLHPIVGSWTRRSLPFNAEKTVQSASRSATLLCNVILISKAPLCIRTTRATPMGKSFLRSIACAGMWQGAGTWNQLLRSCNDWRRACTAVLGQVWPPRSGDIINPNRARAILAAMLADIEWQRLRKIVSAAFSREFMQVNSRYSR